MSPNRIRQAAEHVLIYKIGMEVGESGIFRNPKTNRDCVFAAEPIQVVNCHDV